jgi:hypothetical protein
MPADESTTQDKNNRILPFLCCASLIICIGFFSFVVSAIISISIIPLETRCVNRNVFIYDGSMFRCINDKCRIYNMTYVSYAITWADCIETRSAYLEPDKLNDTLSKIYSTNNTECFYSIIAKCYGFTHTNYFQWISIALALSLFCCIDLTVLCCVVVTKQRMG